MADETTPEEARPSKITVRFPQGLHSTQIEADLELVDIPQIELAGQFLIRQAEHMYKQMTASQQQMGKQLVAPPPGFRT